jgi:hypothetical protein
MHVDTHIMVIYKEYIINVYKYKARYFTLTNIKNTDAQNIYKLCFALALIKCSIIKQKKVKYRIRKMLILNNTTHKNMSKYLI